MTDPPPRSPAPSPARSPTAELPTGSDVAARLARALGLAVPRDRGDCSPRLLPLGGSGTDNVLYRLDHPEAGPVVLRLPRTAAAAAGLATEITWLPHLATVLPVRVPQLVTSGVDELPEGGGTPFAVLGWIPGTDAVELPPADEGAVAADLAAAVGALQRVDLTSLTTRAGRPLPRTDRGGLLRDRFLDEEDDVVLGALAELRATGRLDRDVAAVLREDWERALAAPPWSGAPVLLHADLVPGNVAIRDGRLAGLLDWGLMSRGDPACDLTPAWWVLTGAGRRTFLDRLAPDPATLSRARGSALGQAARAAGYYLPRAHPLGTIGLRTLRRLAADRPA